MPSNQGIAGAGAQTGFKATLSNCLSSISTPKLKTIIAGAAIALLAITGIGVGASSVFGFALLGMAYVATALFLTRLGPKESGGNPQQSAINGQAAQNIPLGNDPQTETAPQMQRPEPQTSQPEPAGNDGAQPQPIQSEEQEFYNTLDVDAQKFYSELSPNGKDIYKLFNNAKNGSLCIGRFFLEDNGIDIESFNKQEFMEIMGLFPEKIARISIDSNRQEDGGNPFYELAFTIDGEKYKNLEKLITQTNQAVPFRGLDKAKNLKELTIDSTDPNIFDGAETKNELLKLKGVKVHIRESVLDAFNFSQDDISKLLDNGNKIYLPKKKAAAFMTKVFGAEGTGQPSTERTVTDDKHESRFYIDWSGLLCREVKENSQPTTQTTTQPNTPPASQPQPVGNDGAKPQPQPVGNGNKPPEPQPQPVSEEEQNFYNGLDNDAKNLYQTLSHDGRKIYEALKNEQTGLVILSDFLKKHKDLIDPKNGEMRKIVEALPEKFDNINTDDLLKIGFDASHPIDLSQYTNLEYVTLTDASLVNNLDQAAELNTIYVQPINDEVQGLKDVLLNLKTNNRINIVFKSKIEKFKFTASEIKSILDNGNDLHPYYNSQRNLLDELFGPANGNGDTDDVRIRIGDDNKKYRFYLVYGDLKVEEVTE